MEHPTPDLDDFLPVWEKRKKSLSPALASRPVRHPRTTIRHPPSHYRRLRLHERGCLALNALMLIIYLTRWQDFSPCGPMPLWPYAASLGLFLYFIADSLFMQAALAHINPAAHSVAQVTRAGVRLMLMERVEQLLMLAVATPLGVLCVLPTAWWLCRRTNLYACWPTMQEHLALPLALLAAAVLAGSAVLAHRCLLAARRAVGECRSYRLDLAPPDVRP